MNCSNVTEIIIEKACKERTYGIYVIYGNGSVNRTL